MKRYTSILKESKDEIYAVYARLAKGLSPIESDLDGALVEMKTYYREYLDWYNKYHKNGKGLRPGENVIVKQYKDRLGEIEYAIYGNENEDDKLVALDNAINQVHIDFDVLSHLRMSLETRKEEKAFDKFLKNIKEVLKQQGKI